MKRWLPTPSSISEVASLSVPLGPGDKQTRQGGEQSIRAYLKISDDSILLPSEYFEGGVMFCKLPVIRQFQSRQLYSKSAKLSWMFHHVSLSQITSSGYRGCPQQLRLCWRHRARCQCHGPVPTRGRGDVQSSLVEGRKGIV